MSRTLKLTIAYDGSKYVGWQRQTNGLAIQQVLEEEIAAIIGTQHPLNAAGRTDSGVHAAGQVASITIDHPISCDDLLRALNARNRDGDIRVRSIEEMPDRWDARLHAKSKIYRYAIWNGRSVSPFLRHMVWHVPHPLDLERMQQACAALLGQQDFAAFQGRSNDVKTTVRRVLSAEFSEVTLQSDQPIALSPLPGTTDTGGRLLRLEISGTGFLRHMVRNITGTLVEIGCGHMAVEDMATIIAGRDRSRAGRTAPPRGLMLWEVRY